MNRLSLRNYNPVLVQEFRKITDRFRGICGICLNSNKGNTESSQHVLTWLHLETLGYWPIMPENLPDTVGDGLQYPLKLVNWSPRSDSLVTSRSRHAYTIYSPTYHVCSYCEAILWIFLIFFEEGILHEFSRILGLCTFEIIIGGPFWLIFLYFYPCDP